MDHGLKIIIISSSTFLSIVLEGFLKDQVVDRNNIKKNLALHHRSELHFKQIQLNNIGHTLQ